ncbi:hypothetical protein ACQPUY_02575 [Clostridium nigeriense]|uniref:hypothetical protein n=1 Tax=Clostridium nigeriense TaxID=1805470 RepID=UPI003D34C5FA
MKEHYRRGGLGDVKIKKYLNEILQEELKPIRERRNEFEKNRDYLYEILKNGSQSAREVASNTLDEIRNSIGINYFNK